MAKRILVVDDEKLIVKGIRFSLEQDGMEVDSAYDGKEALKMAENGRGEPATWDGILKVVEWVKADNNAPDVMRWYEP